MNTNRENMISIYTMKPMVASIGSWLGVSATILSILQVITPVVGFFGALIFTLIQYQKYKFTIAERRLKEQQLKNYQNKHKNDL